MEGVRFHTFFSYSKREENIIIPKVETADSAKDTETLVSAFKLIKITIHNPSAFRGAGLRFPKKENIAIYAINAARRAEIGTAAQIKYANINMLCIDMISQRFSFSFFNKIKSIAVTKDKCAPDTATR